MIMSIYMVGILLDHYQQRLQEAKNILERNIIADRISHYNLLLEKLSDPEQNLLTA
jgi:hypothetical protein